jgi:hypothetical protein
LYEALGRDARVFLNRRSAAPGYASGLERLGKLRSMESVLLQYVVPSIVPVTLFATDTLTLLKFID